MRIRKVGRSSNSREGVSFYSEISPSESDSIPIVKDISVLYWSLKQLFNTPKGIRFFNPEFGCDLEQYLFDLQDEITEDDMKMDLLKSIAEFEPRVIVNTRATTIESDVDNHRSTLNLVFEIKGVEGQYKFSTDLIG